MAVDALKIAKFFKPFVPKPVWDNGRLHFNHYKSRLRFARLWKQKQISSFDYKGQRFFFVIVNRGDVIQKVQAAGAFYEQEELDAIAGFFPPGGVFVDVGANTGQHSIFAARILQARRVVLFEPVLETCRILRENIRLNDLSDVADVSHLGIGLGDEDTKAIYEIPAENLGATRLSPGTGHVSVRRGDDVLKDQAVDFIKIDTEGYEIKVLRGLDQTIRKFRPTMFVEVDDTNDDAFKALLTDYDYGIKFSYRRYESNENYLIQPNRTA